MVSEPIPDRPTVRPDGSRIEELIAGVRIRAAITQEDDRGTICEMISARWDFDDAPLVYAYQVTIRPHKIKGWVIHEEQDDRLFFSDGAIRVVLYDARPDSPTGGMINEFFFSAYNRGLLRIPRGVYHALQNIGETDALFINFPTQPYNHADPDKSRLPLDTDRIPIGSLTGSVASVPDAPLVTVITATYNWSSVLRYAIQSVRWQECQDFEMLVVGDGCTDDSAAVLASFDDPRVRWHNLPENSGSQAIPNTAGLALARGRYIAYLGHDDIWLPSHLSTLLRTLEETAADIAYTLAAMIGPDGTDFHAISGLSASGGYEYDLIVPPSSVMHRRELVEEIGGWKDYRTIVDPPDREFFNRAFAAGKRFVPVPQLTVCKFPSVWRKDSYLHRRSDEQDAYSRRIQTDPDFLTDELLAIIATYALERQILIPFPKAPEEIEPGWHVRQYRRIRGLEPADESPSAPDGATEDDGSQRTWSAQDIRPERYRQALERTVREREQQLAEAERYMRALEAEIARKEQAQNEADHANASLHQHVLEQERQSAEIAEYVRALERGMAQAEVERSRASAYVQSLEGALAMRAAALHDTERYARSLEDAITAKDEASQQVETYAQSLEGELRARAATLQDIGRYTKSVEGALTLRDEALGNAHAYARSLEAALAAKDGALRETRVYVRALEDALAARDEALNHASQYVATLETALNIRAAAEGERQGEA